MASIHRGFFLAAVLAILVGAFGISGPTSETLFVRPPLFDHHNLGRDPLRSNSDDEPCWAEFMTHDGHLQVVVPPHHEGETLLMLSVQDRPQQSAKMTVILRKSAASRAVHGEWHPLAELPDHPLYPWLPPTAKTSCNAEADCPSPASSADREYWFLPTARQRAHVGNDRQVVTTRPVLVYGRVRIVMDETITCDTQRRAWCRDLASRLNNVLIPRVESVFGPVADRQADATLTVIVTPHVRAAGNGDSTIDAFVLATDFRVDLARPDGHELDTIYLHPELSTERSDAILVHELTHAAQFCAFRRHYGIKPWPLQDWQIEGAAHAAEVLLTHNESNVAERLAAFHRSPEQSPLVVIDAAVSGRWRDPHCRGAACSFFTWAAQRFGLEALSQITTAPIDDDDPWMASVGQSWPDVQRAWSISVATAHETHRHTVGWDRPLTVKIDGGATAFFTLPKSDTETALTITSRPDVCCRLTLLRHHEDDSTKSKPPTWLSARPSLLR